jgi:hypothetical protein
LMSPKKLVSVNCGHTHKIRRSRMDEVRMTGEQRAIEAASINLGRKAEGLGEKIEKAVGELVDALNRTSEASESHAAGLKGATWALCGVTLALVLIAGLDLYRHW